MCRTFEQTLNQFSYDSYGMISHIKWVQCVQVCDQVGHSNLGPPIIIWWVNEVDQLLGCPRKP